MRADASAFLKASAPSYRMTVGLNSRGLNRYFLLTPPRLSEQLGRRSEIGLRRTRNAGGRIYPTASSPRSQRLSNAVPSRRPTKGGSRVPDSATAFRVIRPYVNQQLTRICQTRRHSNQEVMMAISKDDVFAACRELEAQGEKPTNRKVAARLGAGGSENICKLLRQYHEEKAQYEPAPECVRAMLLEAADRYWEQALSEAAKRHEGERQELLRNARDAQSDADYVSGKLEQAHARIAEVTGERDRALASSRSVQDKAKGLRNELAHLKEQLASETSRANTLERLLEYERKARRSR